MEEETKIGTTSNHIDIRLFGKKEAMEERQYKELRMPLDDDDKLAIEVTIDGNKILSPNGYLIGKITQVDNGMLVEYVKKRPKYPTTYEECAKIMHVELWNTLWGEDATEYEEQTEDLINALIQLKICRDAYWKVYSEEMGLGKPWEYDMSKDDFSYAISYQYGHIQKNEIRHKNTILVFPTLKIRNSFYENFKSLIEKCKKLL